MKTSSMNLNNVHVSKPYPVLEAGEFRALLTKLRDCIQPGSDVDQRGVYESATEPLCRALANNSPELLGQMRSMDETIYAVGIGDKVFIVTEYRGPRVNELTVYPPGARSRVNRDVLRSEGQGPSHMKRTFDRFFSAADGSDKRRDGVTISIDDGKLSMKSHGVTMGASAQAKDLFALLGLVLDNARVAPVKVDEKKSFFGGLMNNAGFGAKTDLSLSMTLRKLAEGDLEGAAGIGLPAGLADDLSAVAVWRDRTVALTTQRSEGGRCRLWLEDSRDGKPFFREIATPAKLPPFGVSMAMQNDEVHLIGGVHEDGATSKETFVYSLQAGAMHDFGAHLWRSGAELAAGAGWAVPAVVGSDMYVLDGIAKFAKADHKVPFAPMAERATFKRDTMRWLRKSEAPSELVGATVASERRCVVVGPGKALDGRLFVCDTGADAAWYELPALPKKVGLGQVFLSEGRVTYAGGFDESGRPSSEIYTLDLNSLSGRWEHLGGSKYVAGMSRIVRRSGKLAALMVTPEASCMYHLG